MARTECRVADLVAAAMELYVWEERRLLLLSADPVAFGLRFFLSPKAAATAAITAAAAPPPPV
uniref:Uncharacterized protein n=1 Tax=Oryza glumipatula TaxID=40148 RepID=A0A0E0AW78_9ORYZ